jgi:hypothetical protein
MWQEQWTNTLKGTVTKAFFPSVRNRLRWKIPIFPEFVTVITGHGKLKSYLHRFGLINNPMCPCGEEQTMDHLIFHCNKLSNQRNEMIEQIQNTCGTWPLTHEKLVNNYLKPFIKFIKSIDFTDLQ